MGAWYVLEIERFGLDRPILVMYWTPPEEPDIGRALFEPEFAKWHDHFLAQFRTLFNTVCDVRYGRMKRLHRLVSGLQLRDGGAATTVSLGLLEQVCSFREDGRPIRAIAS